MKKIFKYTIQTPSQNPSVQLPVGAKILKVGVQDDKIVFWAEVDTYNVIETKHFEVFGTGWELPEDSTLVYLGTVFMGEYVFHVYVL